MLLFLFRRPNLTYSIQNRHPGIFIILEGMYCLLKFYSSLNTDSISPLRTVDADEENGTSFLHLNKGCINRQKN